MTVETQPAPLRHLCGLFAKLQVINRETAVSSDSPFERKAAIRRAMLSPHESMADLSRAIFDGILGDFPELKNKISAFWEKYPEHSKRIRKSSWSDLKDSLGDEMMAPLESTTCSLAEFRKAANTFIDTLTSEIGKELGLPEPIWMAYGTSGYCSDVDVTVQIRNNPTNIKDAVFYKTMRDCLHIYVFRGFSRLQLHTESLVPHSAQINIFDDLHSTVAHQYFQTGEKASVVLQQYLSLHKIRGAYEKSKQRELASIADMGEREAMQLLYEQVEVLMVRLNKKIEDAQRDLPEGLPYEEVRELVYIPLRLQMAERCSSVQQRIKVHAESSLGSSSDNAVAQGVEALCLELQKLFIMVTILQHEGTISVAEGKATLLEEGGQMHASVVKERRKSVSEVFEGKREAVDAVTQDNPMLRRRLSITTGPGKSDSIARIVLGDEVKQRLRPVSFKRPTCLTFLLAAFEESMQLEHEILGGFDEKKEAGSVAIKSGKYALRVTHNLVEALKEFKNELGESKELKKLLDRAVKLEAISAKLEKCKRAKSIDSHAATILLTDIIMRNLVSHGSADEREITPKIGHMFESFDPPRGSNFDPLMPESEHLDILCSTLGGFKGMCVNLENSVIRRILAAHAGFDRFEYPTLTEVHQKAAVYTLNDINLTTEGQVRHFLDEILMLGAEVRNMARQNNLLAKSTATMARSFDLASLL